MCSPCAAAVNELGLCSTQDLELELKSACDRFITNATQLVARPLVEFVHAVDSYQKSVGAQAVVAQPGTLTTSLAQQPFAAVERMRVMADDLRHSLQTNLGPLRVSLGLYLGSPVTQSILFKPVKVKHRAQSDL